MIHYNLDKQTSEIKKLVEDKKLIGPMFVGQGYSQHVGSDCYGGYVTAIKKVGSKTIYGIVGARTEFIRGWTDGSQECTMPEDKTPANWIIQSGWYKDRATGERTCPKMWYCDENGDKYNGRKCRFSWNGAYAYQDPSF